MKTVTEWNKAAGMVDIRAVQIYSIDNLSGHFRHATRW